MRQPILPSIILISLLFTLSIIGADSSSDAPFNGIDSVKVPIDAMKLSSKDISTLKNYPAIGKWMYQDDMQKAHWLGVKWEGKSLIEPINIIFIDSISKTRTESLDALFKNLKIAGYADKPHHSSGYIGFIGGVFYPQLPAERHHAFSNEVAEIDNNHGRIFGPHRASGKYIYTASFSRESIDPASKVMHHFSSFNRARDEFSQNLDKKTPYKVSGFASLDNAIINNRENTTAEHDGIAVVLHLTSL
jgi:hypothetical protein